MTDYFDEVVLHPTTLGVPGGGYTFGIRSMLTSPPRMLLAVGTPDGELIEHWLGLGDTFVIGTRTWRFEDVSFSGPDHWQATLRYVPADAPPFTAPPPSGARVWNTVELRPFGPADTTQIDELEHDLGQTLPPLYRRWLIDNNGAAPTQSVATPGSHVCLDPQRPLLGVHPDTPYADLLVNQQIGAGIFPEDHLVIAVGRNGLLAVRTALPWADQIVEWCELTLVQLGYAAPADDLCLPPRPVAPSIYSLAAYPQPARPPRRPGG